MADHAAHVLRMAVRGCRMTGPMLALKGNPTALIAFARGRAKWLAERYRARDERRREVARIVAEGELSGRQMVRQMAERFGTCIRTIQQDMRALYGYRCPERRNGAYATLEILRRKRQQPGNEIPDQIREVLDTQAPEAE